MMALAGADAPGSAKACAWACGARRRRSPSGSAGWSARGAVDVARIAARRAVRRLCHRLRRRGAPVPRRSRARPLAGMPAAPRAQPATQAAPAARRPLAGALGTTVRSHHDTSTPSTWWWSAAARPAPPRPADLARPAGRCCCSTGGPHQALRRRHSAAAGRGLRHSGPICWSRVITLGAHDRAVRPPAWTCRSTAAMSAWWTATFRRMAARPRRGAGARCASRHLRAHRARRRRHRAVVVPSRTRRRLRASAAQSRHAHRRRRRALGGGAPERAGRGADPLRLRLPRDRRGAARGSLPTTTASAATSYYQGQLSPDFYAWVFPHGDTASIGTGTRAARASRCAVRSPSCAGRPASTGSRRVRREGAPIPLKPAEALGQRPRRRAGRRCGGRRRAGLRRGHLLRHAGRPARGRSRRTNCLATGDARALATARKRFMKEPRPVFWVLGIMQYFWYSTDKRRETLRRASAPTRTSSASPGRPT